MWKLELKQPVTFVLRWAEIAWLLHTLLYQSSDVGSPLQSMTLGEEGWGHP